MKRLSILLVTIIALLLSGCSADAEYYEPQEEYFGDEYTDVNTDPVEPAQDYETADLSGGDVVQTAEVPALEDRKIIYSADLVMNAPEPETVYNDIISVLDTYSAYVEAADIRENIYDIKVRVLTENFTDFIEEIKESGNLVSFTKSSEDITNTYSTYEIRLAALQARHERILVLISEATDLDVILELEDERYEIEVELNQIGGQLGNFDSLIDFSTVDIRIVKTTEQEIILPQTTVPYVTVENTTKYTTEVSVRNQSNEAVIIYVDVLINGEFDRQYQAEAFEDGTAIIEMDELDSNTEYQLRVTTIANGHRESNVVRTQFTTESTFFNKVGNVFTNSITLLVTLFEYLGLVIVALLPFIIVGSVVFIPSRIVYKKYFKKNVNIKTVPVTPTNKAN